MSAAGTSYQSHMLFPRLSRKLLGEWLVMLHMKCGNVSAVLAAGFGNPSFVQLYMNPYLNSTKSVF